MEAQKNEHFINNLHSAVSAEEYKQMQNMLQPINIEKDRAFTKIDQYNTNGTAGISSSGVSGAGNVPGGVVGPSKLLKKGGGLANLDPLPQMDGLSKILQNTSEKYLLSQSSGFSTYDTYTLKALQQ